MNTTIYDIYHDSFNEHDFSLGILDISGRLTQLSLKDVSMLKTLRHLRYNATIGYEKFLLYVSCMFIICILLIHLYTILYKFQDCSLST